MYILLQNVCTVKDGPFNESLPLKKTHSLWNVGYFVRKVAVLIGWVYFCRVWIKRLFRPTGVTWIFCGFWGWRCLHCCILPLRNLLDSLDGLVVRLVTASCSKPVAEGDIIATAYVTKTVIAADWICQVSWKDTYRKLQPASCFAV